MIRHRTVEGPRPVRPGEAEQAVALCNRVLRPNGPPTIAEEYPRVFMPENAAHQWVITQDDRIISHAATYASTIELAGGATLRLGGLSSVATDPSARRRGYASQLVEACCQDLRAQGCHLAVLWTEVHAFYERLGFASLGSELLYRVPQSNLRRPMSDAELGPYTAADVEPMMALRAAVRPYTRRSETEWAAYLRIPKMQAWVARRGGRCVAYLIVGKGEDFRNCCHEWAGKADALISLLDYAAMQSPRRELILLAPEDSHPLNRALQQLGVPCIRTDLGMLRCLDPVATFEAVRPVLEPRIRASIALEPAGSSWRLRVGDATAGPMSTGEFSALLLGPRKAGDVLAAPPEVCAQLERALPLSLFIWGLDSV